MKMTISNDVISFKSDEKSKDKSDDKSDQNQIRNPDAIYLETNQPEIK